MQAGSATQATRVAGIVLMAGLAVVGAACGGSPAASGAKHLSPHQALLASVGATEAADSAAIGISVSVSGTPSIGSLGGSSSNGGGSPVSLTVSGQGLFSFVDKTGEMTLTIPSLGSGSAGTVQVRMIGSELYLDADALSALDGGKPWVEVDLSQFEQQAEGGLGGLADGDPTEILGLLQQLAGSVTEVGPQNIDGTPTTEYKGTIDLAGGTTSSTIISKQLAQTLGLSAVPVEVWVDSAGRARQVATTFTVVGLTVTAQENLGSFGTPVSVSPPPPAQTADGSSLLQNGDLGHLL